MQKRGYFSPDLATLPNDMSSGSRDLLLALGWLLCKESVLQKFMVNCTTPLEGDDTEALYQVCNTEQIFKKNVFIRLRTNMFVRSHCNVPLNLDAAD